MTLQVTKAADLCTLEDELYSKRIKLNRAVTKISMIMIKILSVFQVIFLEIIPPNQKPNN